MSILIKYTDIAVGAEGTFDVEYASMLPASNTDLVKQEGIMFNRYDIPFELNSMILDGESEFLPDGEARGQIGFISQAITNSSAKFETPIAFNLTSKGLNTSSGVGIVFDEKKSIYATHLNIKWYNDDGLIADEDFYPTGSNYFCSHYVEFFKNIKITFYSLNVPYSRLRVNSMRYGVNVEFAGNELRSAKMIQEIDPISTSVPINLFDFVLHSKTDTEYYFQAKQPLEIYYNNRLRATMFVKNAKRKSKKEWNIQSEDYIGLMDGIPFSGGMYVNKNAVSLLEEIFAVAKVPFSISSAFNGSIVTGYIPYTTCRNALMQVCFAISAIADTSNSDKVNVFGLSYERSQDITKSRLLTGQSFQSDTRVTAVELTSHSYAPLDEIVSVYEAEKSGIGNNVFVKFSEPHHSLSITNGQIISSGVNYAIINASDGCVLSGKKYEHTTTIYRRNNPLVLETDVDNILAIQTATLISNNNVDTVLEKCYNYLVNTSKTSMKIVDGKHNMPDGTVYYDAPTNVGDIIGFQTEYLGDKEGRIIKQTFNLNGGILVKDSVVR